MQIHYFCFDLLIHYIPIGFFSENTQSVLSINSNELTGALQSHNEYIINETSSAVNNTYNGKHKLIS